MLFHKIDDKKQKQILNLVISFATLCSFVFLVPYSGYAEEKTAKNPLPSAPDTGTPEEDFSAGGTRDNRQLLTMCGENSQQITYLLGQHNRDFTLDTHPTFWFYIPSNVRKVANLEFILTEVATGRKIYDRAIAVPENDGLVGLSMPLDPEYALSTDTNYSWSLNVACNETNEDPALVLAGWVRRMPLKPDLQNQLATASEQEKYQVYLQENLYYDALNNLVQLRMSEPNNPQLETAWNQILIKLGWHNLIKEDAVSLHLLSPTISSNTK